MVPKIFGWGSTRATYSLVKSYSTNYCRVGLRKDVNKFPVGKGISLFLWLH